MITNRHNELLMNLLLFVMFTLIEGTSLPVPTGGILAKIQVFVQRNKGTKCSVLMTSE